MFCIPPGNYTLYGFAVQPSAVLGAAGTAIRCTRVCGTAFRSTIVFRSPIIFHIFGFNQKENNFAMQSAFYRRKLPHIQPAEGTFFVTFRLFGSVPKSVVAQLKDELHFAICEIENDRKRTLNRYGHLSDAWTEKIERIYKKKELLLQIKLFEKADKILDSSLHEPLWLRQPNIASTVAEALHHRADRLYTLWSFTIMANHVHVLLTMKPDAPPLWKVLQEIKKFTGLQANRQLGRSGPFWEQESYDHLVRANKSDLQTNFSRILWYILDNPVKAGIVKKWDDYPYTYLHPDLHGPADH